MEGKMSECEEGEERIVPPSLRSLIHSQYPTLSFFFFFYYSSDLPGSAASQDGPKVGRTGVCAALLSIKDSPALVVVDAH